MAWVLANRPGEGWAYSGLKLGGLVEGMYPNNLVKDFLVGVAKRKWAGIKMAAPPPTLS